MDQSRLRTAPALALATLALVAAGGGATAATMINGSRLVNDTVTSAKIKNGTLKKADMMPVSWKLFSLTNGWAFYGPDYGTRPQYTKDAFGFVHLRGTLDGTSRTSSTFARLPAGFRPPKGAWVAVGSTNGTSDPQRVNVYIDTEGYLNFESTDGATGEFVSLEGVTFYAG